MDKQQIEQCIRDYQWMIREIERIRKYLADAGERIVRNYETLGMPIPKGDVRDPVHMEVVRREKQWKRMAKLEEKVRFVQERIEVITDERERTVLDCLLDGMSYSAIAHHMGLSRRHVMRIKDDIVEKIYRQEKKKIPAG